MQATETQAAEDAYMVADGEGEAIWFAGALMEVKADSAMTGGRLAVIDQHVPGGYTVPLHVHRKEDEAWYVLEGEATFHCRERRFVAGPGSWVYLPRDAPHAFKVGPAGARLLTFSTPSGFADFVAEAGEPARARARTILPPAAIDVERLAAIAPQHGVEILGPPPA